MFVVLFLALTLSAGADAVPEKLARPFVFSFMGKAERAAWDLGVLREAYASSQSLREGRAILGGNSSGALLAAYFGCWGVSDRTVSGVKQLIAGFNSSALNLDAAGKIRKIFYARMFGGDVKLEEDHTEIGKLVDRMLYLNGKACRPAGGIVISATNLDVLDSRVYPGGKAPEVPIWAADQSKANPKAIPPIATTQATSGDKEVDWESFDVIKDGEVIGKACTYFVTKDVHDLLAELPRERRQCELRLIENLTDLRIAVLASVAEPTFFEPVVDPEPRKILGGILQPGTRRVYNGGYLVSPLGRDFKRVRPETFVLGTGVKPFPSKVDNLLRTWFTMSPNESLKIQKESLDLEVVGDWSWDTEIPSVEDLINAGRAKAGEVLGERRLLP